MPGAASGAPELRTLPAKGAPSQLRQSPSKRNGTLAPLACELWPPYRCPNPHRVCALNTGVGVLRGFLPRGLCDTGPQVVRDHRLGASSGQVSHNPKQKRELAPGRSSQRCGADCRAQVLRPINFVQLTFVRLAVSKSSDRFVAICVSSASCNDKLQPLHCRHRLPNLDWLLWVVSRQSLSSRC